MDRRKFLTLCAGAAGAGLVSGPVIAPLMADTDTTSRFQFCLLQFGKHWDERRRALVKLSFEVRKRCNIPIETQPSQARPAEINRANSPFFILSGRGALPEPAVEEARLMRLVLNAGGILLFDDTSPLGDNRFRESALAYMGKVFPEVEASVIPNDHALFQSYYLLKEPRGRLNKTSYLEGWTLGHRTRAFFSHNDLLGAMEADQLGTWTHPMEIGGGFRRELCFRLGINFVYYTLTINYKKDRAFPPIIERRRRQ